MAEGTEEKEPTLVERWLQDQQQWQRTILAYLDSMVKDDQFLVHFGNAMRGSLLAGKPYPTATPGGTPDQPAPADDRLDHVLFALHQLQGQLQDLALTLEEVRQALGARTEDAPLKPRTPKVGRRSSRTPPARKRRARS